MKTLSLFLVFCSGAFLPDLSAQTDAVRSEPSNHGVKSSDAYAIKGHTPFIGRDKTSSGRAYRSDTRARSFLRSAGLSQAPVLPPASTKGLYIQPGYTDPSRSTSKNAASSHAKVLSPPAAGPKDGNISPAAQRVATLSPELPVTPAHNRSPSPVAIGGPTFSPGAKNAALLNGTGLKHKP
jgi:hypothetical protein